MRTISNKERRQRGCVYCMHYKKGKNQIKGCEFNACPFRELDKYHSYYDYLSDPANAFPVNYLLEILKKV